VCDGSWKIIESANVVGTHDDILQEVAALSSTDTWAVGYFGFASGHTFTLAEHWDSQTWSVVATPNVGSLQNDFMGVHAVSSTDVWAVGDSVADSGRYHTLAEHWDGGAWTVVPTPEMVGKSSALFDVNALADNDVWAVGQQLSPSNEGTPKIRYRTGALIEHWDGSTWNVVPNPMSGALYATLQGVAPVTPTDVWAVGTVSDIQHFTSAPLIEHWDGSRWIAFKGPAPHPGNVLYAVDAVSSDEVWGVGQTGSGPTSYTLVEEWDGSRWRAIGSPNPSSSGNYLFDVAAVSADDIWAAGSYLTDSDARLRTLTEHWDGSAWAIVPSPNFGLDPNELYGVSASARGDVWAVGKRPDSTGQGALTLTEHYC